MIDKYKQAFQEEARELLTELESALPLGRLPGADRVLQSGPARGARPERD